MQVAFHRACLGAAGSRGAYGIQGSVDVLGRHGHLGSLLSVWVAAWGNRLVVRYLASRDVHELVPSLRPGTQGSIARAARQGQ